MALEGLKTFFSNHFETTYSADSQSATHYYSNDYRSTKEGIIAAGKELGYKMTNIDDRYKEMLLISHTGGELIFTLTSISYYETAVDMKVTTHHIIPAGRAKKKAIRIYEELNRLLTLKREGGEWNE